MMVFKHIMMSAEEQMKAAEKYQALALDNEIMLLCSWGERRVSEIEIPEYRMKAIRLVYQVDGNQYEVMENRLYWDLERSNSGVCRELDRRIAKAYRVVKAAGFKRPSTVLHGRMLMVIHSSELSDHYNDQPALFAAVRLVVRRLETTARIAARYDQPDVFGPRVNRAEDGTVLSYEYTTKYWEDELVRRGVLGRSKSS